MFQTDHDDFLTEKKDGADERRAARGHHFKRQKHLFKKQRSQRAGGGRRITGDRGDGPIVNDSTKRGRQKNSEQRRRPGFRSLAALPNRTVCRKAARRKEEEP